MSDKTKIEWTDATWNPVTGCTRVSPGCTNCYIDWAPPFRIEGRHFTVPCEHCGGTGFEPMTGKFRDSHTCSICKGEGEHTFQVLTKRHGRMRVLLKSWDFRILVHDAVTELNGAEHDEVWPPPNVWVGVTVEDQQHADLRIPALLATPAAVRFLSCEPLLGPVTLLNQDVPEPDADTHANEVAHHLCNDLYADPLRRAEILTEIQKRFHELPATGIDHPDGIEEG